jgi:ketosteroid isomerase-like protein
MTESVSANLDLVRSIYADWERGDFSHAAEWAHPEIELVSVDGPDPGRWTGLAAMAAETRWFMSAWENFRLEAQDYRELDDERVLVLYLRRGQGKTSGFEVEHIHARGAGLFHVRREKVARLDLYWDRDRALADLGLES